MHATATAPIVSLVDLWADRFGYLDGKIDLKIEDLSSLLTPDCTLTAHAPLWRTKPGEEKATPATDVRKQLARMMKFARVERHDMHMAAHPDGDALCLYFVVKMRLAFLPFTLMTVPLAFVVQATETADGLRISEIHERPAADQEAARRLLIDQGWPADTSMEPVMRFGAAS